MVCMLNERSAPVPSRPTSWQFLRGGENCCHGDRLGTEAVGSTSERHNNQILPAPDKLAASEASGGQTEQLRKQ